MQKPPLFHVSQRYCSKQNKNPKQRKVKERERKHKEKNKMLNLLNKLKIK